MYKNAQKKKKKCSLSDCFQNGFVHRFKVMSNLNHFISDSVISTQI